MMIPNEFHKKIATNPLCVTEQGSELFQVDPKKFANWMWQMKHQIQSPGDVEKIFSLSDDEKAAFPLLKEKFHAGISPYSATLIDFKNEKDPVRLQLFPKTAEMTDALGVPDPLQEINNSPVKELVHVYKDKIAWCVAQLCPVYCRYCFRKRRDEEVGLHFNPKIIDAGLNYIQDNKQIRDVLITGGDPFIAQDGAIENLLQKLRSIPHVEIIRFGTRTPVALPYRITPQLAGILEKYHPIWVNTHFNCTAELTPEAVMAVDILMKHGVPVGNQSVFLKDVNDNFEKMKTLLNGLIRMRVRPYYVYHPQIVEGTEHLRIPMERGLDIMKKLRGATSGFAIPQYVLDTPTGKVPLSPNHILGRDGDNMIVEQLNGRPWAEPNPIEESPSHENTVCDSC